jgi:hypothetical protein
MSLNSVILSTIEDQGATREEAFANTTNAMIWGRCSGIIHGLIEMFGLLQEEQAAGSLVHGRSLVIFFAISVPSSGQESAAIVRQKAPLCGGSNSSSPNRILLKVLQRGEGGPIGG